MKKLKSVITEFSQESQVVNSWEGSFTGGYLSSIGFAEVEISSESPLDRGEYLGKEVTIIVGDDEPEVLTQEFIDGKKLRIRNRIPFHMDVEYAVPEEDLQDLLVTKQELPVIPKFVAEVIVEHKELGYDVYDSIDLIIETNGGELPSISDWVAKNIDKYARAWLDGYTVEVEQKYVVKLPMSKNNDNQYAIVDYLGKIWTDALPSKYKITEEEIRGLTKGDILFEYFAVKVEEFEE